MFILLVLEQSIHCQIKYLQRQGQEYACGDTELLFPAGPTIPCSNSLDVLISQL